MNTSGGTPKPVVTQHDEIEAGLLQIASALIRLARGDSNSLASLLHDVETHADIDGTKVTAHCHCLKIDGNGRPRVGDLVKLVAEHSIDYAIPRSEISKAHQEFVKTGSMQKIVRLANEARALFTNLKTSGEGGELLLFALAEKVLGLPQIICKMSLKTNAQMHVHGSDGLHIGVDQATGKLLLYWGESKIYSDAISAVTQCLASVAPMLSTYSGPQRDLQLLQRHSDLDDADIDAALKKFLDPDSSAFNSLEFRGLCLVGFDCDAYPDPSEIKLVTAAVAAALPALKTHVKNRINAEGLGEFSIHLIFVPFPSAEAFRLALRKSLGIEDAADSPSKATPPTKVGLKQKKQPKPKGVVNHGVA